MTMSLELGPDTERRVREYAEVEGISIKELIDRAFPPRACKGAEEIPTHLQVLLARRYAETNNPCLKHKSLSRIFSGEATEESPVTPEEYADELKFWEDYDRERSSCYL